MITKDEQGRLCMVVPLPCGEEDLAMYQLGLIKAMQFQFLGDSFGNEQHNANYRLLMLLEESLKKEEEQK